MAEHGSVPTAVRLGPGQVGAAAAALAASHADYPAFRHVFPDPARRARALPPFFAAAVADAVAHGTVFGVLEGARALGVGVWLPPGGFPWTSRRKLRATPAFLRVLAADPLRFPAFTRYGANAERAHPAGRHWYLVVLGVRPEAQGRGIGTAVLEPVLHQADSEGVDCHLETSDRANVAYYERFGFSVVDDALPLVPGGPTHVAMRRPPSPRRGAEPRRGHQDQTARDADDH